MIGVVDYGAGNLQSVRKAFDFLGVRSRILSIAAEFNTIDRLVLPGVGSFGHAVESMIKKQLYDPTAEWIRSDRPFLGICLGLQLLFESSKESVSERGFSVFKGICKRFAEKKVPQIGWNYIRVERENELLRGIHTGEFFYFVHSYYVDPMENGSILALSNYGVDYPSVIGKGNVFGVQFHPEKSGRAGLRLLKNWVERC